jgi:hypothetical protein
MLYILAIQVIAVPCFAALITLILADLIMRRQMPSLALAKKLRQQFAHEKAEGLLRYRPIRGLGASNNIYPPGIGPDTLDRSFQYYTDKGGRFGGR